MLKNETSTYLSGYNLATSNCREENKWGGGAIYIKEGLYTKNYCTELHIEPGIETWYLPLWVSKEIST